MDILTVCGFVWNFLIICFDFVQYEKEIIEELKFCEKRNSDFSAQWVLLLHYSHIKPNDCYKNTVTNQPSLGNF